MSETHFLTPEYKLTDFINVQDATSRIVEFDPEGIQILFEEEVPDEMEYKFTYVRGLIHSAIRREELKATVQFVPSRVPSRRYTVSDTKTRFRVDRLLAWLEVQGFNTQILPSQEEQADDFRNPNHPRYSAKLAAAVEAWEKFDPATKGPGTPKQHLAKWLWANASRLGLVDAAGKPSENVIEELAKVANWAKSGGAPKKKAE